MEQNNRQDAAVKQEFAIRRKRQILVAIAIVGIFLIGAVAMGDQGKAVLGEVLSTVIGAIVFVSIILAIGFSLWNWRCPGCNRYLGKQINPKFCVRCGVPLR